MPFSSDGSSVDFEHRPHYLYANLSGPLTDPLSTIRSLTETFAECRRLGYKDLLLVRHGEVSLNFSEVYQVANQAVLSGLGEIRMAVVIKDAQKMDHIQFGVDVTHHKGTQTRLFDTVEAADHWPNTTPSTPRVEADRGFHESNPRST
ncbi:MAG: hypothetical protein QUS14_00660 [Pyrinomonadaceae bacterium]|nr:hypothetical protein [Pyrinomonadaceae bacterium]